LLIAGVSLDVNVVPAALSALNLGYEPYIVVDASGTFSKQMREISMARFIQAGVIPITWFAIGGELMTDWLS
jgi:nicotinamidase-related amidase